ncbi:pimeloyl-CoA dehydrogenase large subunit [Achromobacter sp. K91]|uniref:acyl-CoA dehydrogenase family protein n=1 Tax=Achromobacter sp. K91 TaxID=2292262 RepID=UPI000E669BEE|nr:acyl-CoA dehydrogenase family protein [Achromobacter sp. K91]RIJ03243.1 pimeloyl-CoA dehydrogenase large subunit [Achromobacter sp. K91]
MKDTIHNGLEEFRAEIRQKLQAELLPGLRDKFNCGAALTREDFVLWQKFLARNGWLAPHWPKEHGGPGWTVFEKFVFDEECAMAGAPRVTPFLFGIDMLGPVLLRYGTSEQKLQWLPRILDGSDWWCQGFSEPGSGSDLSSLRMNAVRECTAGEEMYVLNGQKIWTSYAHYANMMFCLVRTKKSDKQQHGISFLLVDMASPGVEVRPIKTLEGSHVLNEVFFTDVRVPATNLVGTEHEGWRCAKHLLGHERSNIAGIGTATAALERVRKMLKAQNHRATNQHANRSRMLWQRFAQLEIDLNNLRTNNWAMLQALCAGEPVDMETSILKIRGAELQQQISTLARIIAGQPCSDQTDYGQSFPAFHATQEYFYNRKLTIVGGTTEVHKNIVARLSR